MVLYDEGFQFFHSTVSNRQSPVRQKKKLSLESVGLGMAASEGEARVSLYAQT